LTLKVPLKVPCDVKLKALYPCVPGCARESLIRSNKRKACKGSYGF